MRLLLSAALLCGAVSPALGAVIGVPTDERAIATALRLAARGDTVRVAPGLYRETLRIPSGVRLEGAGGEGVTLLQGDGESPVVTVPVGGRGTELIGFTISGGTSGVQVKGRGLEMQNCILSANVQSGVEVAPQGMVWLRNCRVVRNPTGITCGEGGFVSISGCLLAECETAVQISGADLTMHRSRVAENDVGIEVTGENTEVVLGGAEFLGNDFIGNHAALKNLSQATVSAAYNFWGAGACDSIGAVIQGPAQWLPASRNSSHTTVLKACP